MLNFFFWSRKERTSPFFPFLIDLEWLVIRKLKRRNRGKTSFRYWFRYIQSYGNHGSPKTYGG